MYIAFGLYFTPKKDLISLLSSCDHDWTAALCELFFSFVSSTSTQPRLGLVPRWRPTEGEAASELAASWRSVQCGPPVSAPVRIGLLAVRRHGRKALKWRTPLHFNKCDILATKTTLLICILLLYCLPVAPPSHSVCAACNLEGRSKAGEKKHGQ